MRWSLLCFWTYALFLSVSAYQSAPSSEPIVGAAPRVIFNRQLLDNDLVGDYGVRALDVNNDGAPDAVAIAWGSGQLVWYENGGRGVAWPRHLVADLPYVVWFDAAGDLNGDGLGPDLVVAYNFTIPGTSGAAPAGGVAGGTAGWLEHPVDVTQPWKLHPIADVPALHRLLYSHTLQAIVCAPLFGAHSAPPDYLNEPSAFVALRRPANLATQADAAWTSVSLDLQPPLHAVHAFFHFLPESLEHQNQSSSHRQSGSSVEQLLVGAQEGLFTLAIDETDFTTTLTLLSTGVPLKPYSPYSGVSGVDVCLLNQGSSDSSANGLAAYMPTVGPWEGVNQLTPPMIQVNYPTRNRSSVLGLLEPPLRLNTLTTQGPQGHYLVCGDFTGDDQDDFLVGMRGPFKTIQLYSPTDPSASTFRWWNLNLDADQGASGLAVADFDGDGKLDFVATGFPGFGIDQYSPQADKFVAVYWNDRVN
eukprot:CAMPEP_0177681576 /NCGR_PEP_ID=MMETSP0447-20121125/30797_1 /TAXON_ID=0 /ORGANISM="Stygamoeba regulata, Strain BSH-02190019" /LENGTH=473 /DNA_ID=CAMNT_0019191017 /DNA_START=66 /DNA_END=1487 /DNA_ORIENTATION=-